LKAKKKTKIKVFFVDDHPIVCSGLRTELSKTTEIECVGEATSGKEALEKLSKTSCDVILIDMDMPDMNGLKTSEQIFKEKPDARIIAIHDNDTYLLEFMCMGAMGYLLKDVPPDELVTAIKSVHTNSPYLSLKIDKSLLKRHSELLRSTRGNHNGKELSKRESEVLIMLANGFSNKEIAFKLKLSVRTVESHRNNIMKKLNIKTISGLTKYAISKKMIKAD
jgi:DNA-binding NarL/FixJ family response regulator